VGCVPGFSPLALPFTIVSRGRVIVRKAKGEDCPREADGNAGVGRLSDNSPGARKAPPDELDERIGLLAPNGK
jgi:hypothetical protein